MKESTMALATSDNGKSETAGAETLGPTASDATNAPAAASSQKDISRDHRRSEDRSSSGKKRKKHRDGRHRQEKHKHRKEMKMSKNVVGKPAEKEGVNGSENLGSDEAEDLSGMQGDGSNGELRKGKWTVSLRVHGSTYDVYSINLNR